MDNIKTDLWETGCGDSNWTDLVLDRNRCSALKTMAFKRQVPF
jgi:hypothetical protein